jgi:hypothetical protein
MREKEVLERVRYAAHKPGLFARSISVRQQRMLPGLA